MKFFITILVAILSFTVFAQSDPHNIHLFQNIGDSRNLYYGLQPKSSGILGSPFIFDDMLKGDIVMKNGKHVQGIYINIFPEKAEIFIKGEEDEDAKVVVLDNKLINQVIYPDTERTFSPMKVGGVNKIAEIIINNEREKLIALHEKKFIKAQVGGAYNPGPKYDSYEHIIRYFIISGESQKEIVKGKSGLKTLDADSWKTLMQFVKDNKLDMENTRDMKAIYLMARKQNEYE